MRICLVALLIALNMCCPAALCQYASDWGWVIEDWLEDSLIPPRVFMAKGEEKLHETVRRLELYEQGPFMRRKTYFERRPVLHRELSLETPPAFLLRRAQSEFEKGHIEEAQLLCVDVMRYWPEEPSTYRCARCYRVFYTAPALALLVKVARGEVQLSDDVFVRLAPLMWIPTEYNPELLTPQNQFASDKSVGRSIAPADLRY
jgi:hypothetical protein